MVNTFRNLIINFFQFCAKGLFIYTVNYIQTCKKKENIIEPVSQIHNKLHFIEVFVVVVVGINNDSQLVILFSNPSSDQYTFSNVVFFKWNLLTNFIFLWYACYFGVRHWASTYISLRCATLRIHSFRHANASDRDRRQSLGLLQAGPKFFMRHKIHYRNSEPWAERNWRWRPSKIRRIRKQRKWRYKQI